MEGVMADDVGRFERLVRDRMVATREDYAAARRALLLEVPAGLLGALADDDGRPPADSADVIADLFDELCGPQEGPRAAGCPIATKRADEPTGVDAGSRSRIAQRRRAGGRVGVCDGAWLR